MMIRKTIRQITTAPSLITGEGGQALLVTALCMVVLVAFLGLAIDVGNLRYAKRNLQMEADEAALAAGLEVRVCGTTPNCPAMLAAATDALKENGVLNVSVISNCASAAGAGLTMVVNNPPCELGSGDPNTGKAANVEVEMSEQVQTYFSKIVGYDNVPITARAEASRSVGGPCIYALDTAGPAIQVNVALGIQSQCAIVDESTSSDAFSCLVAIPISAPSINVAGAASGLLCLVTPAIHTGVAAPTPADPLAYLPAPATANDACGTSKGSPYSGSSAAVNIILGGTQVFNPGVYCGGISITATVLSNITFNPGIYILRQGPGLLGPLTPQGGLTITVSLLSSITGNGVMFYNEGQVGSLSITAAPALLGLGKVNLSAATSGEYGGVLFFQAHGDTSTGTFLANLLEGSSINGAIYLPDAMVTYGVSAISSDYNILVAKDINFNISVLSTFGNNYSTLQSGSPLNGDTAVLVQ